jgi:hypothetical protein
MPNIDRSKERHSFLQIMFINVHYVMYYIQYPTSSFTSEHMFEVFRVYYALETELRHPQ